jgi:hypothetical protein
LPFANRHTGDIRRGAGQHHDVIAERRDPALALEFFGRHEDFIHGHCPRLAPRQEARCTIIRQKHPRGSGHKHVILGLEIRPPRAIGHGPSQREEGRNRPVAIARREQDAARAAGALRRNDKAAGEARHPPGYPRSLGPAGRGCAGDRRPPLPWRRLPIIAAEYWHPIRCLNHARRIFTDAFDSGSQRAQARSRTSEERSIEQSQTRGAGQFRGFLIVEHEGQRRERMRLVFIRRVGGQPGDEPALDHIECPTRVLAMHPRREQSETSDHGQSNGSIHDRPSFCTFS